MTNFLFMTVFGRRKLLT